MARTSVNLFVGAGSAVTLAALLAGLARADGYSLQDLLDQGSPPIAGIATLAPVVIPGGNVAVDVPKAASPALPALAPLTVAPARAFRIEALPGVQIADLEGFPVASAPLAAVDVGAFVSAPPARLPAQVITVVAAAPAPPPVQVQVQVLPPTVVQTPPPTVATPPPTVVTPSLTVATPPPTVVTPPPTMATPPPTMLEAPPPPPTPPTPTRTTTAS